MNDITQPLRLAIGTHRAGSGVGCAMNVVSWENGDTEITDFPACSSRALARMVQAVNDTICTHSGADIPPFTKVGGEKKTVLLCPDCSQTVLRLGHLTVGTAGKVPREWLAELFTADWGVIYRVSSVTRTPIEKAAEMIRRQARDEYVDLHAKVALMNVLQHRSTLAYNDTDAYALLAAYNALGPVQTGGDYSYNEHAYEIVGLYAGRAMKNHPRYTEQAILAWHRITGTTPVTPAQEKVSEAVGKMTSTA